MSEAELTQLKMLLERFHALWDERMAAHVKNASTIELAAKMEEYGANQKNMVLAVSSMAESAIAAQRL